MASPDGMNLDDFLNKIDVLEDIVKGFKSKDEATANLAIEKADKLLEKVKKEKEKRQEYDEEEGDEDLPKTKTGFSKTSINKSCSDHPAENDVNYNDMGQAGFMKALEADANERAERRKARGKIADALKEKGNAEFKQGNFEQALDFYTQALQEVKDNTALYTNRAQAYIKLGKYSEAIGDCEWALRVFPNCLKAFIHQGRAHLGLKEYKQARDSYTQALACDPKKQTMIAEYQAEVDRAERAEKQEKEAREQVNPEDPDIPEMLTGVQKPHQQPLYYSGGFRVLKALLVTTKDRTLFRTNGGLDLLTSHDALNKCLTAVPKTVFQEELDMITAAFDMFTEACRDNEKSTEVFLQKEDLSKMCMKFLEEKLKGQGGMAVKVAMVTCLCVLSQTEVGRRSIIAAFDVPKLLALMFNLIRTTTKTAAPAATLLNNLALENKFKAHLRDKLEDSVCPAFESLLKESKPVSVLPQCVSMVTNLSSDETIRTKLGGRRPLWEGCVKLLTSSRQKLNESSSVTTLDSVLGLLMNVTTVLSQNLREFGVNICDSCLSLIKDGADFAGAGALRMRALGVMSNIAPQCIPAADSVVEKGGTVVLLEFLKDNNMVGVKCALKCLTACTQINEEARNAVVANKGLGSLIRLLGQTDEVVVGNAALCLSHCTQVHKVCAALTKTDIIKDLLVLARDGKRPTLQQNCAILIAKLAHGDSKHLERLRELHGTEILHSCMKHLN